MNITIKLNDKGAVEGIGIPEGMHAIDTIAIMGYCITSLSNAIKQETLKDEGEKKIVNPTLTDINKVNNN